MRNLTRLLIFIILITACTPGNLEQGSNGIPITRNAVTSTASIIQTQATPSPTRAGDSTPTQPPTPMDLPSLTPALTVPATAGPPPTMTPVPPFPGFRYRTKAGIWQVNAGWQPEILTNQTDAVLSNDGAQALYLEGNDIWLLNIADGESINLTWSSGRSHCCLPRWQNGSSDTILFGSWPTEDYRPSFGYLSAVKTDGSGYTVLADNQSNAEPALSPDGQRIAYDLGGSAWIYDFKTAKSTELNLAGYNLNYIQRIAGPSWSPDGRLLAWTIAANNPNWRISVVVFDLQTTKVQQFHEYENVGRGGWFPGPGWHPEGEWLAFVAEDANPDLYGVWVMNIVSGEEQFLGRGINPIWSPDGQWLAYEQYIRADRPETVPMLVEFDSWYHLNLWIPDSGQLLDWVIPDQ